MLQTVLSSLSAVVATPASVSDMARSDGVVCEAGLQDAGQTAGVEAQALQDVTDRSRKSEQPMRASTTIVTSASPTIPSNIIPSPPPFRRNRQSYLGASRCAVPDGADASDDVGHDAKTATTAPLGNAANVSFPTTATTTPTPSMQHIEMPPLGDTTPPLPPASGMRRPMSGFDQLMEDLPVIAPPPRDSASQDPFNAPSEGVAPKPVSTTAAPGPSALPEEVQFGKPRSHQTGRVARYATMPVVLSSDLAFRSPMTLATPSITPHQLIVQKMRHVQETPQMPQVSPFQRNSTVATPFLPSSVGTAPVLSALGPTPASPLSREHAVTGLVDGSGNSASGNTESSAVKADGEPALEGEESDPTFANGRSGVVVPWYRRKVCCW